MANQQETWTLLNVLNWTKGYLADKGVDNARLEAEWLLCAAMDLDRVGLYLNFDKPLTDQELDSYRAMVARRAKREPLQYILGSQEFYGLEFSVNPATLIPRHDTELLVEEALKRAASRSRVLDIGVGSGCIACAMAKNLPEADVWGVDISPGALAQARENSGANSVNLTLLEGSLFEPLAGQRFNIIVSNPPYIPTCDLADLQPEVREFEPLGALDGGPDGLDFYRQIIPGALEHLQSNGWLLLEVGIGQAGDVEALFGQSGFSSLFRSTDSGGIERVVGGKI